MSVARILIVATDPDQVAQMTESFDDAGHESEVDDLGGSGRKVRGETVDVVVASLDGDAAAVLDRVHALQARCGVRPACVLFVGSDETRILGAAERFPRASFTRRDALLTAIASLRV